MEAGGGRLHLGHDAGIVVEEHGVGGRRVATRHGRLFPLLGAHLEVHAPGQSAALRGVGVLVAAQRVAAGVVSSPAAPPPPAPPHLLVSPDAAPGGPSQVSRTPSFAADTPFLLKITKTLLS